MTMSAGPGLAVPFPGVRTLELRPDADFVALAGGVATSAGGATGAGAGRCAEIGKVMASVSATVEIRRVIPVSWTTGMLSRN